MTPSERILEKPKAFKPALRGSYHYFAAPFFIYTAKNQVPTEKISGLANIIF